MAKLVIAKGCHGVNKLHVHPQPMAREILIFFPGDRIEKYGLDPEIQRLQDPSEITSIMSKKFPAATVVVITSSRMEAGCACYAHFFDKLTLTGEPLGYHGSTFKASQQLYSLLEDGGLVAPGAECPPITLVGFSKGGVVLNQLLAELAEFSTLNMADTKTSSLPPSTSVLRNLHKMHYLDAGLNCRGAYLTDPRMFEQLGRWRGAGHTEITIALHGTPRQWEDPSRPFIAQERDRMISLCQQNGIPLRVEKYFNGERPSLAMHFQIVPEMRS